MDNKRRTKTIRVLSYNMRMNPISSSLFSNREFVVKTTTRRDPTILSTHSADTGITIE